MPKKVDYATRYSSGGRSRPWTWKKCSICGEIRDTRKFGKFGNVCKPCSETLQVKRFIRVV